MIFNVYWPLALSWLFMSTDNPIVTSFVSRMADPEINLGAHGGVVYPVSLLIESPIMMMISVSIAMAKDKINYRRIYKLMMWLCFGLTVLHSLIAFTPLFNVVIRDLMGIPTELLELSRIGLTLMIPWTWSIGYRRMYHGILILGRKTKQVTVGSFIRMVTLFIVALAGYLLRNYVSGAATAAAALSTGVMAEAVYIGIQGRKVIAASFEEGSKENLVSWRTLAAFCIPLVMMQFINLGWTSIGSAAMSRMLNPLISLAVWPVLSDITKIMCSFGNAVNETTLSLVQKKGIYPSLRKFSFLIAGLAALVYVLIAFTPVGDLWFRNFSGLTGNLFAAAKVGILFVFLTPVCNVFLNFYQAISLSARKSRFLFEGLLIFLVVLLIFIAVGIKYQRWEGIYVILTGMNAGFLIQTIWMRIRSAPYIPKDTGLPVLQVSVEN